MVADSGFWIKCSPCCTMFQNGFIPSSLSAICLALVISPKKAQMIDSAAFLMNSRILTREVEKNPDNYHMRFLIKGRTREKSPDKCD